MDLINNKRKHRRILAVCNIVDEQDNLIGFTLDLTKEGIRIIVANSFPKQQEFYLNLKAEQFKFTVKVEQKWRGSRDENFDEIGGILVDIQPDNDFEHLLKQFNENARIYDFDPS